MDLITQYQELHSSSGPEHSGGEWFPGKSTIPHTTYIATLIDETNSTTLLDYGCGKGWQYSKWEVNKTWNCQYPTLYDPGVFEFSEKPTGTFDGVINIDVLEHIEEKDIEAVLSEIFSYADKFVYLSIALFLGTDLLPDGRNMHVTVKPTSWWKDKILKMKPPTIVCHVAWRHNGKTFTHERL